MESTGQTSKQSPHLVQIELSILAFFPTIAIAPSTGHLVMQSLHPIQVDSSIHGIVASFDGNTLYYYRAGYSYIQEVLYGKLLERLYISPNVPHCRTTFQIS